MSALLLTVLLAADSGASLQERVTHRAGRLELAPSIAVSVNDPFFTRLGGTLRAAFHVTETFAVALRGGGFAAIPTDDLAVARRELGSVQRPLNAWLAMADVEWAPIYGKAAIEDAIIHFDVVAIAGLGVALARPAFDVGGAARVTLRQAVSLNVSLIDTAYVEPAGLQHALMLSLGLSVLLPLRS